MVITMGDNNRTYHNPYSLINSPYQRDSYKIAVRRMDEGRGGSLFLHHKVKVGDQLKISAPMNRFGLNALGRKHILIAGGIGITPFLSQLNELQRLGANYELHYAFRNKENAAFLQHLLAEHGKQVRCYESDNKERLDVEKCLTDQPLGSHVYVCGPAGMIEAVASTALRMGWPDSHVHSEEFISPPVGDPFVVVLGREGRKVSVSGNSTILETLEELGLDPPCMCRGGVCGQCETTVLDGEVEHHDHFLSDQVKASHKKIMICVSRARSKRIVLDI